MTKREMRGGAERAPEGYPDAGPRSGCDAERGAEPLGVHRIAPTPSHEKRCQWERSHREAAPQAAKPDSVARHFEHVCVRKSPQHQPRVEENRQYEGDKAEGAARPSEHGSAATRGNRRAEECCGYPAQRARDEMSRRPR